MLPHFIGLSNRADGRFTADPLNPGVEGPDGSVTRSRPGVTDFVPRERPGAADDGGSRRCASTSSPTMAHRMAPATRRSRKSAAPASPSGASIPHHEVPGRLNDHEVPGRLNRSEKTPNMARS